MRDGGRGDRSRDDDGDLLGDAAIGVGTASAGIADKGGIAADAGTGGTAGRGVRERVGGAGVPMDGAGDRDLTGVGEGVYMGSWARSACGR